MGSIYGRLDLLIANQDDPERDCRNDDGGVYTCSNVAVGDTSAALGVRLADVNQDGR